jgi:hypothetical protein
MKQPPGNRWSEQNPMSDSDSDQKQRFGNTNAKFGNPMQRRKSHESRMARDEDEAKALAVSQRKEVQHAAV